MPGREVREQLGVSGFRFASSSSSTAEMLDAPVMTAMTLRLWFLSGLALAACSGGGDSLTDFQDIALGAGITELDGKVTLQVDIGDPAPDVTPDSDKCPTLDDGVRATANGKLLDLSFAGGVREPGGEFERCDGAFFHATLDAVPDDLVIVVSDDSRTLTANYSHIRVTRTLSAPTSPVRAGQEVELVWSDPDDDLSQLGIAFGASANSLAPVAATVGAAGHLTITVPAVAPGTYQVSVYSRGARIYEYQLPYRTCSAESCYLNAGNLPLGIPPTPSTTLVVTAP